MNKWVRRSLEAAILTAGFVAVGTAAAHASEQGGAGNAAGTETKPATAAGVPDLGAGDDALGGTVEQATQTVKSTVATFGAPAGAASDAAESTGAAESASDNSHGGHSAGQQSAGQQSASRELPTGTEAAQSAIAGSTSGLSALPKPDQLTGAAGSAGALASEMTGQQMPLSTGQANLPAPKAPAEREGSIELIKPGTAGLPVGLTAGFGNVSKGATADPAEVINAANAYAVVPTQGGHEVEIVDAGVNGRDQAGTKAPGEENGLSSISAPLHATVLSIDSGRDVQDGTIDQSTDGSGSYLIDTLDLPVSVNALAVDSGNNAQNGDVKQTVNGGHGVVGVANTPLSGNVGTWHTGNEAQNGSVTQASDQSGEGAFRLIDNWNVPANAQHLAVHNGNTTQNGDVDQSTASENAASQFSGLGNTNLPVNGSWLSFDSHNATQNGNVTQSTESSGASSVFSVVDNANIPVTGSGQAGGIANVSQNGDVQQENVYSGEQGSFGSGVTGVRNLRLPIAGAGQAGVVGNNSQNGEVGQVNRGTTNGSSVSVVDNGIVTGTGAGQAGVVGNSVQNGDINQINAGTPATQGKHPGPAESEDLGASGSDVRLSRNLLVQAAGAGQAGDIGNGSQNGDRWQGTESGGNGSTIALADNAVTHGTGAGQAGVVGNGVQNGEVCQQYVPGQDSGAKDSTSPMTGGWGSAVQAFRNADIRAVGAGQAGVIGNGAQNQEVTQLDSASNPGFSGGVADNANLGATGGGWAGVVGNGAQNGTVQQNATSSGSALGAMPAGSHQMTGKDSARPDPTAYGYGGTLNIFRNVNFPVAGQGVGGGTGNGSQNRDVVQAAHAAANGATIRVADNASTPVIGQGVGGVQGNGAQNGSTDQHHQGAQGVFGHDGRSENLGSNLRLLGNGDIPVNGSGVSAVNGNGSQNSHVTQADNATNNGTTLGATDNLNLPVNGAGVGGFSGDGAQNGNVDQTHTGDGFGGGKANADSEVPANGADFTLVGHNTRTPIVGTGAAGATGHGSQNGNIDQANNGNGANDIKLSGNHDLPVNANGAIVGTGNGIQNVDTEYVNDDASVNDSGLAGVGVIDNPRAHAVADSLSVAHTNPTPGETPESVDKPSGGLLGGTNATLVEGATSPVVQDVVSTDLGRGGLTS